MSAAFSSPTVEPASAHVPGAVFELNPGVAALLAQWRVQHGHDPRDLVNAAVTCTLCSFDHPRRTLGECLKDARAERLQATQQEMSTR